MKHFSTRTIVTGLIAFVCVYAATSLYLERQETALLAGLDEKIVQTTTTLAELANVADRDGGNETVDAVISDCSAPERERFDLLLGRLSTLTQRELIEVQQLFSVCGSFFSERKSVVVLLLENELAHFENLVALKGSVVGYDRVIEETELTAWQTLVQNESKRARLSRELVAIQGDIINDLLSGATVESELIIEKLKIAQTAKDTLTLLNTTIDVDRAALSSI